MQEMRFIHATTVLFIVYAPSAAVRTTQRDALGVKKRALTMATMLLAILGIALLLALGGLLGLLLVGSKKDGDKKDPVTGKPKVLESPCRSLPLETFAASGSLD